MVTITTGTIIIGKFDFHTILWVYNAKISVIFFSSGIAIWILIADSTNAIFTFFIHQFKAITEIKDITKFKGITKLKGSIRCKLVQNCIPCCPKFTHNPLFCITTHSEDMLWTWIVCSMPAVDNCSVSQSMHSLVTLYRQ